MHFIRALLLLALSCAITTASCGEPIDETDETSATLALTGGGVTTNGAPGGGNGFCCIHPGGGYWVAGEVDPVTGQAMATQSAVRAACAAGHLQARYLFSC